MTTSACSAAPCECAAGYTLSCPMLSQMCARMGLKPTLGYGCPGSVNSLTPLFLGTFFSASLLPASRRRSDLAPTPVIVPCCCSVSVRCSFRLGHPLLCHLCCFSDGRVVRPGGGQQPGISGTSTYPVLLFLPLLPPPPLLTPNP